MSVYYKPKWNKLLLMILIIAALLRFVGTKPGYNQYHADEGISYSAASSMIKNGNLDSLRYDYPALVPLINYVFFKFVFIPAKWSQYYFTHISEIIDGVIHIPISKLEQQRIFQVFVLGERNINALFWGRYVTALFSLGNVFLIYLLGKKLFNKKTGLIAAFLLTFNYKHVINSHIGLPDIYNAFFLLASLLFAVNLWQKPTRQAYLLAGIVSGLSFSVKYQFFGFIPIVAVHICKTFQQYKINKDLRFGFNIILTGLVAVLLFFLINPYHFLYLDRTIEIVSEVSRKYAMGTKQLNLYPFSYFFHIDYGPVEFILIFVGILLALKRYLKQTLLLMTVIVPFFYIIIYYSIGGFYIRNFISTTPLLLLFAGLAVWQIFELLKRFSGSKLAIVGLCLMLAATVFLPARNSIINSYYYTKPWGYDVMRPWIEKNLPKDVPIAAHPFDARNLNITNKRSEFEISGAYSLAEHKENGAKYALMNLNWAGNPFYFWMSYGFDDLKLYWNKPIDLMNNTYHGIAAEELFRYQIYTVTKPWQAPDTHLIVAKLFDWPDIKYSLVNEYNFDENEENWAIYGKGKDSGIDFRYDPEIGQNRPGSVIVIPAGSKSSITRISSPLIPIKEEHLYKIAGFLKTDIKLDSDEREGFIRIDFYGDKPDLEKVGIISSVSSRVYGTNDWVNKKIIERAPVGSKYLVIGFQTYVTNRTKIWLDDVTIEESIDKVKDITSESPYIKTKIDLNYLYPNSHGNL